MPAHLGILYPPLCSNLRIISRFFFFFLRSGADGAVWNKNTEAFPAPRWPLSEAQPLRQGTERRLAYVVVLVSLCYQSRVHRVKQGSSSSSGKSCVLGRLAEDTKEKEMWEDGGRPDHGGWEARNTIKHTHTKKRGRNEARGEVRILKR